MTRHIDDPVFGDLHYDGYFWVRRMQSSSFGDDVELLVQPPVNADDQEGPPVEAQRQSFARFQKEEQTFLRLVERALYDYYRGATAVLDDDPGYASSPPRIREPADVWAMVKGPATVMVLVPDADADIAIGWEATRYHPGGIRVQFKAGQVQDVGPITSG